MFKLTKFALCLFVGAASLTSCSDDDGPSYSERPVENSELKTILTQKGYRFNDNGNLLLDEKATSTTSLDLSGTEISTETLSGLGILPNLKEVDLSDNGYGPAFDFAVLPTQITGIDLTGNEIYDYNNLVNVVVEENGDETVTNLRTITKLYLPEVAKNNCTDLMRFYRQNKEAVTNGSIDMQMEGATGTLAKYTTLRDIPDDALRTYLKESFSDLFDGDKVDISKHFGLEQKSLPIYAAYMDIKDFDGIQYVLQNPSWEGPMAIIFPNESASMPCFEWPSCLMSATIYNVDFSNGMNMNHATQLRMIWLSNVDGIEEVDFSHSTIFGQREPDTEFDEGLGSGIILNNCKDIKSVRLPEHNNLCASAISIEGLPNLEQFDLTKFAGINQLLIGDVSVSYNLEMPTLTIYTPSRDKTTFAISEKTYNQYKDKIVSFIDKYYTNANPKRLWESDSMYGGGNGYRWW